MPHCVGIERINRAFKEGASKLAHSKGFANDQNYAALGSADRDRSTDGASKKTHGEPGEEAFFPDSPCFSFRSFLLLRTKLIETFPGEV
jgi:hypothetical protein